VVFSADLILNLLATYLWAFARIAAMLMVMVVVGSRTTPTRIRLFYALSITFAVLPILPPGPADIELFSFASALVLLQQILIGIAIGSISIFVVQTFVVAGQIIAMQTSLGFASMADPSNGQSSSINGLLATDYYQLAGWFSIMFSAALAFSIASMVAMLLVNLSFGIMTKAAPQLNIFSLGFSVSMVFGLFVLWLTLINVPTHFENQWMRGINMMCEILNNVCEQP